MGEGSLIIKLSTQPQIHFLHPHLCGTGAEILQTHCCAASWLLKVLPLVGAGGGLRLVGKGGPWVFPALFTLSITQPHVHLTMALHLHGSTCYHLQFSQLWNSLIAFLQIPESQLGIIPILSSPNLSSPETLIWIAIFSRPVKQFPLVNSLCWVTCVLSHFWLGLGWGLSQRYTLFLFWWCRLFLVVCRLLWLWGAGLVASWHVGSYFPDQELNLRSLRGLSRFLTTGPPRESCGLQGRFDLGKRYSLDPSFGEKEGGGGGGRGSGCLFCIFVHFASEVTLEHEDMRHSSHMTYWAISSSWFWISTFTTLTGKVWTEGDDGGKSSFLRQWIVPSPVSGSVIAFTVS